MVPPTKTYIFYDLYLIYIYVLYHDELVNGGNINQQT